MVNAETQGGGGGDVEDGIESAVYEAILGRGVICASSVAG